jgi:hypothetical protein
VPFVDSVAALTEDILLSVKNNFPCKIMEKSEGCVVTLIIAPMIESK